MNFHPVFVQFPIALLMASVLFDLVGILFPRSSFRGSAVLLLVLGVVSSVASGFSGDLALQRLPAAQQSLPAVIAHRNIGTVTVWLAVFQMVFRMYLVATRRFVSAFRALYLALGLVMVTLLSITGFLGGILVFEHGIGVKQAAVAPNLP